MFDNFSPKNRAVC